MQKREFISRVAAKTGMTKVASDRTMDAVFQTLAEVLAEGDRLQITGFGVFNTRRRAARSALDPRTGGRISVSAQTMPVFRPTKTLKERLNQSQHVKQV